jgi:hypothetical protein
MTLWCVMLISQAYLIRIKRLEVHRLIGKASYVIAPVNVVLMLVVARNSLPQVAERLDRVNPTVGVHFVIAASFVNAVLFGVFFALAMRNRRTPAVHARYMLCTPLESFEASFQNWRLSGQDLLAPFT